MKSLRVLTALFLIAGVIGAAQAQGIRPEVGRPLQAASDLLKAGKAREALAKAREADAMERQDGVGAVGHRPHEGRGRAARRRHRHDHRRV
ncbi:MAG: hypothetical protein HC793_03475 [Aquincola sp.]|nr:hypothetical protein [Aquincola sp.]